MDKRTLLAIVLSFVILFGWNYLAEHMGWMKRPETNAHNQAVQQTQPVPPSLPAAPPPPLASLDVFTPSAKKAVTIDTPLYTAVLNSSGGILQEFTLKRYKADIKSDSALIALLNPAAAAMAPLGLLINGGPSWSGGAWEIEGSDVTLTGSQKGSLQLTGDVNGVRVVRTLTFAADSYVITEQVRLASATQQKVRLAFTMSSGRLESSDSQYNRTRIAYYKGSSFKEEDSESTLQKGFAVHGEISWASVMSNYFVAAVALTDADIVVKGKLQDGIYRIALEKDGLDIVPGKEASMGCVYYLGPKEKTNLAALPNNLEEMLNFGFFSVIAKPLMVMLAFFYQYVHNYGIAIILLTIVVKVLLWPLSYKSYKSMEQMKKLQPMMAKLKEKYKDDKEGLNREMMQLYKTYKVNPLGGCLPILVQIPVFFGLYQGLLNGIELRHASFITHVPFTDIIWLADLSAKDPFYITPLVMGGTMFLQQWLTPAAGDPTQQKMMLLMPVVFTFLFLNFPSGLVVYWLANNIISILQQWLQLRKV